MQAWRRAERARLELKIHRRGPNRPAAGTFSGDAATYLRAVRAMPSITMRRADIARWVELFGARRRDTISADEIRAQRDTWLLHGPKRIIRKATREPKTRRVTAPAYFVEIDAPLAASTVNHRLRALSHFWTVLDGPSAYNPVREVPEADEGDGEPRGIPQLVAQAILDAMPERGRGIRHHKRATVSQTKARLRVMYWTGLSQRQLARLRPKDVDLEARTLYVERRKKGKGAAASTRPLTPEAVEAFTALDVAAAWDAFSTSSMRASFRRACKALGLEGLRPYDFRHSLATDIYTATHDVKAVQEGLGHADIRTSMRYMQAAVSPVIAAAMQKVSALRASGALPQSVPQSGADQNGNGRTIADLRPESVAAGHAEIGPGSPAKP